MGVYLRGENWATQGPAPDGFHVPLTSERAAIVSAGVSDGAWGSNGGSNMKAYLKLPYCGTRSYLNGNVDGYQDRKGTYWSSSQRDSARGYCLFFQDSQILSQNSDQTISGCSVRPFYNKSVTPDSSWTALYSDKIYHNSSLGLISVKNGSSWITIADKNVGATTVYNSGDTLSESNCGKFFQRGNNYGFPYTGSVTTSGTQVNAGTYGPNNYYSSSTFITRNSNPYSWDSSNNANLWGGVDGNVLVQKEPKAIKLGTTDIKKVYLGSTQVRPKVTYLIDITDYQSKTDYTGLSDWAGGFNTDGTKYFCGINTSQIGQYTLSTAYDLDSGSTPTTLNVGGQIHQVYVSPDGTHLACASYSNKLYTWDMTTPRDITTATNQKTMSVSSIVGVRFKPDGTRVYVHRFGNGVYQYDLSTPRDVTTATSAGSNGTGNDTRGVSLSNDGTIMIWNRGWTTYQVNLTTPRDVSSTVSGTQKSASLNALQAALTHDNSRLICASRGIVEFKTN